MRNTLGIQTQVETKQSLNDYHLPQIKSHSQLNNHSFLQNINQDYQQQLHELKIIQEAELVELLSKHSEQQLALMNSMINYKQKQTIAKYKPYTLDSYRNIKELLKVKFGKLGSSMPIDKWSLTKEQRSKMQEYAEKVKQVNDKRLRQRVEINQEIDENQTYNLKANMRFNYSNNIQRNLSKEYSSHIPPLKMKKRFDISGGDYLINNEQ